jgi:signal transduction histidine kinase/CheY-like chemotaxis protein
MTLRSCLLQGLFLVVTAISGAANADWRDVDKIIHEPTAQSDQQWHELDVILAGNPEQAVRSAEHALREAQEREDKRGQLESLRILCQIGGLASDPGLVRKYADQGVALAREVSDMDALAWLLYAKSSIEFRERRRDEAAATLNEAMQLAEQRKLGRLLGWIYIAQGERLFDEARLSDAMAWFSKAYPIFEAERDNQGMAMTLSSFAFVRYKDEAQNSYKASLYNWEAKDEERYRTIRPASEETVKAIEYLTRALSLIDPNVYQFSAQDFYYRLGLIYSQLRDQSRAGAHYEKALGIARKLRDSDWTAELEYRVASQFRQQRRYDEALAHLDAAWLLALQDPANPSKQPKILLERAAVFAFLGQQAESLEALSQAETLMQNQLQKGQSFNVNSHYTFSAGIYAKLGEYRLAYRQMTLMYEQQQRFAAATNRKRADEYKVRFDVQLKEAENALLRSQQKEADTRRVALSLALALSLLLLSGVVLYLRRRAAAAKLEVAHHRALAAAEAAANQAKGTFLANMSHELRTPLNVVLGFTQVLMRDADLREETQEDLAIIYKSGHHLYTLINQVLDLSKIEAGRMTLDESEVDLYALLDELTDMFAITAKQKNLQLTLESNPEVPHYVRTDALKLRQVLINLLNNALKFTREGGVALNLSARAGEQAGTCVLSFAVTDTGPGIAADELAQLGSAFVQAQAGQQASEGTGLGLAISSSFVRLMGGELRFSSRLGEGTTAAFELMVQAAEGLAAAPIAFNDPRVVALAPDQPRYRILAVDDRPESRQVLVRLLTPLGFEVREAGNGEEAITLWEKWEPNLILMDMRMPVMDGRQAARQIRAMEKGKRAVIIALTSSSFESEREQILADGCDDFLRKPFREEVLFESMGKHLGAQFIYQNRSAGTSTQAVNQEAVAALPAELLEQLEHAVIDLDIDEVERLIEEVRASDAGVANALAQMAYRYEYRQILELIRKKVHA